MMMPSETFLWNRFSLREAIYLGFCAAFIIITRIILMLHLKIPGHAMFFTIFFLLLARGSVPKTGSATMVGLVTGILSAFLGLGKEGPFIALKFLLPGFIVDLGGVVYPGLPSSYIACIIVGILASATRFVTFFAVELLIGMEKELILGQAVFSLTLYVIFGGFGSLMVPPIIRRLKANRLIENKI
jgi:hypothetical protein